MRVTGVSAHFVHALLEGTASRGLDSRVLLKQAGIDPVRIEEPTARVTAGAYAALMLAVSQVMDDEFFGQDSGRMKVGSFAMLCHAVISCRSLHRALHRALKFYGLMLNDVGGVLRERDGQLCLELEGTSGGKMPGLFAHENLMLFLHRLACWLVNRRIPLTALAFAFPQPRHADEYKVIFDVVPIFDRPRTCLTFDARYGVLPVVRNDAALKDFLALAPENLVVRYRPTHGTAHRVRRHLAGMALAEWPAFTQLARLLGMSASTLHRRLAAEDLSFQAIKDQIRRDRAMTLLRQTDRSVMAIAEELGFAEPSAFHRAFRKWEGGTPGQVRRGE